MTRGQSDDASPRSRRPMRVLAVPHGDRQPDQQVTKAQESSPRISALPYGGLRRRSVPRGWSLSPSGPTTGIARLKTGEVSAAAMTGRVGSSSAVDGMLLQRPRSVRAARTRRGRLQPPREPNAWIDRAGGDAGPLRTGGWDVLETALDGEFFGPGRHRVAGRTPVPGR